MGIVRLAGTLACATPEDARLVADLLPEHLRLTLAEPGCLSFTVTPSEDRMLWQVAESFADRAAFAAHQARTRDSAWGRATSHIARAYRITEDGADDWNLPPG